MLGRSEQRMNDTLFDLPDEQPTNKYIEPMLTKQERLAKIARQPKLETIASPDQKLTSTFAALDALPKMRGIKKQIVELLEDRPEGLTCSEFCELTGREKPSCSPRFVQLEQLGVIYADGTRLSNLGREATVYKLVRTKD